jgi:hypothetical protein
MRKGRYSMAEEVVAKDTTKYNVKLKVSYEIVNASDNSPFASASSVLDYSGMNIMQVTVTEGLVVGFAQSLVDTGFMGAALKGYGADLEKLKATKAAK